MQLIRVSSIPAVVSTILETYGQKFQVPFVVLGVEANRNETGEFHVDQFRRLTPGSVERLMGDYDRVLSPIAGQEAIIFVDNADEVQSCALYRLSIGMQRRPGVLAFWHHGNRRIFALTRPTTLFQSCAARPVLHLAGNLTDYEHPRAAAFGRHPFPR